MHVISVKDPVEIKWRDNVLSIAGIFHCEYLLHPEGVHSLEIAQLLLQFSECDEANSHRWHHWTPRKTTQGNRRLGGQRRRFVRSL